MATKIATCCYCGARAALLLRGKDRHELACGSCGAPLHDLKQMPAPEATHKRKPKQQKPFNSNIRLPKSKDKRKKRRRGFWDFVKDGIEDVVDEIFD